MKAAARLRGHGTLRRRTRRHAGSELRQEANPCGLPGVGRPQQEGCCRAVLGRSPYASLGVPATARSLLWGMGPQTWIHMHR